MDINILRGLIIVWWFLGFVMVIHEMRRDFNINIGGILFAMLCGVLGPLWLIATVIRKTEKIIIFKKN